MAVSALHTHHISEKRMEISFKRPYGFKLDVIVRWSGLVGQVGDVVKL